MLNNFPLFSLIFLGYNKAIKIKRNIPVRTPDGIYKFATYPLFHFFLSSFLVAKTAANAAVFAFSGKTTLDRKTKSVYDSFDGI